MDRFECRERILEDLKKAGLLEKVESYRHAVGHCYRCKAMIEPLLSKQWFVRVAPLAEAASKAVSEGRTRIHPANWEGVYFEWMNNIRDWCVSRQIWWGHRIPAWYCTGCGEVLVAREEPRSCTVCQGTELVRETDVLDTWFSSALWPFSTLGWPDEADELETFYPTSVLVTGFDILFFWVARMMMMGIHFRGDVPFKDVYIHALVRDAEGQKMSKSKGNVIDPLEVMDRFGTDAFRFTLAALAAQGRDVKLSEERILGYRHFVNKIWNAARLVLMNLDPEMDLPAEDRIYTLSDRWALTRLGQVSEAFCEALEEYRFNDAAGLCYQFVWHEFCDWYLEMAKERLYGEDGLRKESCRATLSELLEAVLQLLHPFMPFVTEEIWQKVAPDKGSIMVSRFPDGERFPRDDEAVKDMEVLMGVIAGIRNIRGEMNIPPAKTVDVQIDVPRTKHGELLRNNVAHIRTLAKVNEISIDSGIPKPEASATAVSGDIQVHVRLRGLLDFDEEKKRLRKEIQKLEKDLGTVSKKLSNKGFLEKAPAVIVDQAKERVKAFSLKLEKLNQNLSFFEALRG
jgi:valyl-tRNA synthetase